MRRTIAIGLAMLLIMQAAMYSGCKEKRKIVRKHNGKALALDWAVATGLPDQTSSIDDWTSSANQVFKDNDVGGPDKYVQVTLQKGTVLAGWDCACHELRDSGGLITEENWYHVAKVLRIVSNRDAAVVTVIRYYNRHAMGIGNSGLQVFALSWIEAKPQYAGATICHEIGHRAMDYAYGEKDHMYHIPFDTKRVMYDTAGSPANAIVDNCPQNGNEKAAYEKWANTTTLPIWWEGPACGD